MEQVKELPEVEILRPQVEDWQEVKNLRLEALQKEPQAFGATYESALTITDENWQTRISNSLGENPKELLVVARENGEFVGMIAAYPKTETTWNIISVYVKEEYRGQKISSRLFQQILDLLESNIKPQNIELTVNVQQEAAIQLYLRNGFQIIDTLKNQKLGDGKLYDEYLMRKV